MGFLELFIAALGVGAVIVVLIKAQDKRVIEVLGPNPMSPHAVRPDVPVEKVLQLLVAGLTTVQDHGGWRIRDQTSNTLTAEIEYRSGSGRDATTYFPKIRFHAQFHPVGQQTEIKWHYEDASLTSNSTPPFGWNDLCDRTNGAILARLGLI